MINRKNVNKKHACEEKKNDVTQHRLTLCQVASVKGFSGSGLVINRLTEKVRFP